MSFILHPQLANDCAEVTDWPLCRILLMKNARFPWLILVPRRESIRELFELAEYERMLLMSETSRAAEILHKLSGADKINIAALGNQVAQLHMHVIARFHGDGAWPNPVWNSGLSPRPYTPQGLDLMVTKLRDMVGATAN